jgi:hypothetical protein
MHRIIALSVLGGLLSFPVSAQKRRNTQQSSGAVLKRGVNDSLKDARVDVYQTYVPEVRQVSKPVFAPTLPPSDTARVPQKYNVPQQALFYTYTALPLRPLALTPDSANLALQDYVRLGFGNRSTVFFDGATTRLRGEGWQTVAYIRHLSQSDKAITAQKASQTEATIDGRFSTAGLVWDSRLEGAYKSFGLYGFNDGAPIVLDRTNRYWLLGASAGISEGLSVQGFSLKPKIGIRTFNGPQAGNENTAFIEVPAAKVIDSGVTLALKLEGIFTTLSINRTNRYNNLVGLSPSVMIDRGRWNARLGLKPFVNRTGEGHVLPDLAVRYSIPSQKASLFAGWEGKVYRNTLEDVASVNPYLTSYYPIQSRVQEAYAGLSAGFGNHLSASAKASWWRYRNLPMFVNDYISGNGRGFYLEREPDAQAVSVEGSVQYAISDVLSVGGTATLFDYYKTTESRLWHVPGLRLRGDLTARPLEGLTLSMYLSILDQIYALNAAGEEVKLKGTFDLGGGAEYQLLKRWSILLQVNNLLGNRNERFLGYPSFGLTAYGGIRFKF